MKTVQGSTEPEPFWIRKKTDTDAYIKLRNGVEQLSENQWKWNEVDIILPLQSGLETYITEHFTELWELNGGGWPVITKFSFRQLLTPTQKLVWDNFEMLQAELTLTAMQVMQMRSFKADFDSARKVTMNDAVMTTGLQAISGWNLLLDAQPVFTSDDVDRILAGTAPE